MKNSNTKMRLRQIMEARQITQTDILKFAQPYCEKYNVKLTKSNLSQYVSGKNEPGQDKIAVLSMALDVSEGWLMGYDVPMERRAAEEPLDEDTRRFIELWNDLDEEKRQAVIAMLRAMGK